jgi:shikimate dehydrogenase
MSKDSYSGSENATYLLGLIGHPVSHSLSPAMHKAALAHFGMKGDYRLYDIEPAALEQKLQALCNQGIQGLNVTIPHKLDVFSRCKKLSEAAQNVGAVNTVRFLADGGMEGHNTDLGGFASALGSALAQSTPGIACLLGAGGAAKAAILALIELGVSDLKIVVRDPHKAERLVQNLALSSLASAIKISVVALEDISTIFGASLIVNTLPIGQTMIDTPEPIKNWLKGFKSGGPFVFDMVYSRTGEATPLVKFAEENGFNACDGAEMLIWQAAFAFQFWTERMPPLDLMRTAFREQQQANRRS